MAEHVFYFYTENGEEQFVYIRIMGPGYSSVRELEDIYLYILYIYNITVYTNHRGSLCTMHSLQSKCTCELFGHPLGLTL